MDTILYETELVHCGILLIVRHTRLCHSTFSNLCKKYFILNIRSYLSSSIQFYLFV